MNRLYSLVLCCCIIAVATTTSSDAAVDTAALKRAIFRNLALAEIKAPAATIEATTACWLDGIEAASDGVKFRMIDIDKTQFGQDRRFQMNQMMMVLSQNPGVAAKLKDCMAKFDAGAFGPTTGAAMIATAAPNPGNVVECPVMTETITAQEHTCYCRPLQGGIAYGHKTYSDTSSVCIAALNAGVTDFLTGGVVTIAFKPGCASYPAVMAFGYPTGSEKRTKRSFYFPKVGEGSCPQ